MEGRTHSIASSEHLVDVSCVYIMQHSQSLEAQGAIDDCASKHPNLRKAGLAHWSLCGSQLQL